MTVPTHKRPICVHSIEYCCSDENEKNTIERDSNELTYT